MKIRLMQVRIFGCGAALLLLAAAAGAKAQSTTAVPIQQGLWETTINTTSQISLPPDVEAKIAAMPAAQQAMIKQNMGGGSTPSSTTTHSCAASQMSMTDLLNQAQQKDTKCTFSNQAQTPTGYSFDIACTMPQGSASGHSQFQMPDSSHVTGTTHMTMQATTRGGAMSMTLDSTLTSKYLGADCGSVKPNTSVAVK